MARHLPLPFHEREYVRPAGHGGGSAKDHEDKNGFSETQIFNLDQMENSYLIEKKKFSDYFDPNLIFKIIVEDNIDEDSFSDFLNRCDIQYLSPGRSDSDQISYFISLTVKEDFEELKNRLNSYCLESKYKTYFNVVHSFEQISPEDKTGKSILKNPPNNNYDFFDIELWRMDDDRLDTAVSGIVKYIEDNGGSVTDQLITENICLIRVKINDIIFNDIINLNEISHVERPPRLNFIEPQVLGTPLDELRTGDPPDPDSPCIILPDSGVYSGHPLLKNGIGDEIAGDYLIDPKKDPDNYVDDVGHGTKVAGIALYGDILNCLQKQEFKPDAYILSCKVLYGKEDIDTGEIYPGFDDEKLFENQLIATVNYFLDKYPDNQLIVNISIGNPCYETYKLRYQHPLASVIDELACEYPKIIFVTSVGNNEIIIPEQYPKYLLEDTKSVKIIDPATSVYSLSVGSIAQNYIQDKFQMKFLPNPDYPSLFTRVGPGLNGMIKPELVEMGGNIPINEPPEFMFDSDAGIILLNPKWFEEDKLFTIDCGTSFSAPKVANHLAKLCKEYPNASSNTIKAFLIASAKYPVDRPSPLDGNIKSASSDDKKNLTNVYGYGKPSVEQAISSDGNHVFFFAENKVKINGVHFYQFPLPREFIELKGKREISVTLVYNPPVRRRRMAYIGTQMKFKLFKNTDIKDIEKSNTVFSENDDDDRKKFDEIQLQPSLSDRSKGLHQKGVINYIQTPSIDPSKPLILGVYCSGKWMKEKEFQDYMQDYSVVVSLEHRAVNDLYVKVAERIRTRVRI